MADEEERQDTPEGQEPETGGESTPQEGGDAVPEEATGADATPEEAGEDATPEEVGGDEVAADAAPEDAAADAAPEAGADDAAALVGAPSDDAAPEEAVPSDDGAPAEGAGAPQASDEAGAEQTADEGGAEQPRRRTGKAPEEGGQEEVIPGAHLEPDLVLEEQRQAEGSGEFADAEAVYGEGDEDQAGEAGEGDQPVAREPLDLAADARYAATGKRKTAIARVILRPGEGQYTINGRHLDQFFPRVKLQRMAQQPLETAGYNGRMDVVARIHGGGVSAQAGALRHGIARALVEADPNLRLELKRRGFLTRDPREKERKKAGLKKARKRPQFSKR